jgi:DNA-binding IclR family transcriptional regulator
MSMDMSFGLAASINQAKAFSRIADSLPRDSGGSGRVCLEMWKMKERRKNIYAEDTESTEVTEKSAG